MKIEGEVRAGTKDDEVIAENALKQRIAEMYADLKLLKKQDGKIKLLMEQTAENNAKDKAITQPQGVRKKKKGVTFCGTRCSCEDNDKEKTKEQGGRSSPENLMSDQNEFKDEAKMPKATKTMEPQGCSKTNGLRPQHATDHCPVGLVQDFDDLGRYTDVLTDMRPLLKGPKTAPIGVGTGCFGAGCGEVSGCNKDQTSLQDAKRADAGLRPGVGGLRPGTDGLRPENKGLHEMHQHQHKPRDWH